MSLAGRRVARFFDQQLPAAVRRSARAFAETQGALAIIVEGAGSWTITFGDAGSPTAVVDEADIDADCIAVWSADAFVRLLQGKTAPGVAEEPIALLGEQRLLARLGALLSTGRAPSSLGQRLGSFAA